MTKIFWQLRKKRMDGFSLNTIAEQLYLSKSTVQYMAVNDYSRPKMKSGQKKKSRRARSDAQISW